MTRRRLLGDVFLDPAFEQLSANVLDLREEQRPLLAHDPPHRFTDVLVVSEQLMNAVSVCQPRVPGATTVIDPGLAPLLRRAA